MLQPIKTQLKLKETSQDLLKHIENKRVREVLEKRFGLKTGDKKTLEAIGKEYGITRERVRQIEADGLRALVLPAVYSTADLVFKALREHIEEHGGVAAEHNLLFSLADAKSHAHATFLLTVGKPFSKKQETDRAHPTWYTDKSAHDVLEKVLDGVYRDLEIKKVPVRKEALIALFAKEAEKVLGHRPKDHVLLNYLGAAKLIGENPYGEFGLISWPTIRPKGVRDKAYMVLQKSAKPMHFRAVAEAINKMNWAKKAAHPQTVHNELIKAQDRFVLVGRGLYALREWGYLPGTVADVVKGIINEAGKPLGREEIVSRVLAKRFVKENTILLNLQNRNLFTKEPDGKYFVA
ncbi:MAG: hypothetical protein HY220_00680 [Candidatus Sungbacteria bacterium]|uniref:HTH HARE-type domain-containing protein n=1 Tax=Candidatus Sungiibacteriota bacterium TaxID=2750080 RepID=A0A9D6LMK1_9BACT|nr:hypothetical protein [Candidatus Sungbacteria bacterium]